MYYQGHFRNWPRPVHVAGFFGFLFIGLLFAATAALLFGLVLMLLWNWLMPAIFGLPLISFWQAWGLVVLSHIFFKSSPHHFHKRFRNEHWKTRFRERFHRRWDEEPENDSSES